MGKGVVFEWLGYFTDGKLRKEFLFDQDSFEEVLLHNSDHVKDSRSSTFIKLHVSGGLGVGKSFLTGSSRIFTGSSRIFNASAVDGAGLSLVQHHQAMADFCHHLLKVESVGRSVFFALRKSAADRVTIGLIQSSRDGPVILLPSDQEAVRAALFGNPETWVPEMVPFLDHLLASAHPLLLKAHNETGFMPRFTEITGAPNFKSGLFYLREKMLNMEYDTKEKFYLATYQFFRAMKRYCEEMEKEAGAYLATPLPKSVWKYGNMHLHYLN